MQMKPPPAAVGASVVGASVVKRECKFDTLKDFVAGHLNSAALTSAAGAPAFTLVARSAESPACLALAALSPDITRAGITVRVVFQQLTGQAITAGWTKSGRSIAFAREVRWARNPRLIDAHEQLVLGAATAWVGDSMRRDPATRDAFENFAHDCALSAHYAAVSFARLWAKSEEVARIAAASADMDEASIATLPVSDAADCNQSGDRNQSGAAPRS